MLLRAAAANPNTHNSDAVSLRFALKAICAVSQLARALDCLAFLTARNPTVSLQRLRIITNEY